jgi:hypothetical protein
MTPSSEQDGIHPPFFLGTLKEAVRDPEHQSVPILGKIRAVTLPRFLIELHESRTSAS